MTEPTDDQLRLGAELVAIIDGVIDVIVERNAEGTPDTAPKEAVAFVRENLGFFLRKHFAVALAMAVNECEAAYQQRLFDDALKAAEA